MRARSWLLLCVLLILCGRPSLVQSQPGALKGLDDYVAQAMRDWEIPGLALAVVKDDAVVLAKGYGVRKLGDKTPVDAGTLFAIASNSKAFTAAALAMLVDDGKIRWDDPVIKHLPGFQLYDPYVTREITVRDLLCHRSGLERHDLLWLGNPAASRDAIMSRLRFIKPTWSFRSKYGPAVTGKSWDDFVQERIFNPLGMSATSTSVRRLDLAGNVATPHQKVEGKVRAIAYRNVDNVGPAGSINSSVADMSHWLRLHLNKGLAGKKRLLSAAAIREMQTPQMIIPRDENAARLLPESHFLAYGLGFLMLDYRGRKVVQHGGSLPGMNSQVCLVPEDNLGIVVLTNFRFNALPMALPYRIIDAWLGGESKDWSARALTMWKEQEKKRIDGERKEEDSRVLGTKPSLPLEKYAGTFKNELYGDVQVKVDNDKLTVHYGPAYVGELAHWHFDTFRIRWNDPTIGKGTVTFHLDARGRVSELVLNASGGKLVGKR
jgi:CubicO group peptidase (beta-lactamase class C family)